MDETTQLPLSIERQDLVYEDRNQKLHRVVARFEGFTKEYFVSDYGQRAAVVAVKNSNVLLVRQYRLLVNDISHEIPGGRVEDHETPEQGATRECLEEARVQCFDLRPLVRYQPSLDIWNNCTYIFFSENCSETPIDNPDRRVWVPMDRALEMIFGGQIQDSLSIIAILAYHTFRHRP